MHGGQKCSNPFNVLFYSVHSNKLKVNVAGVVLGCGLRVQNLNPGRTKRPFFKTSRLPLRSTKFPVKWVLGFFLRSKVDRV
jgi:hypothetical protein